MDEFPLIEVPLDAPNRQEPMGSKEKFWFGEPNEPRKLFKQGRLAHGEDWAEKIAAEIAELLGIPHATIDLATWDGKPGIVTPDFCHGGGQLTHGNELMVDFIDPQYPASGSKMRVKQHTVDNAMFALDFAAADAPDGLKESHKFIRPSDAFVGYLMLDALIGNTDRHHENWGIIFWNIEAIGDVSIVLAPSFDHASSLGRELRDGERLIRLDGRDKNRTIARYLGRAEGRFFGSESDPRPLSPISAFQAAGSMRPVARLNWLERLRHVNPTDFEKIIGRIPSERMSNAARRFALDLLQLNRRALLGTSETT
ncbi:MAG TPA: HipA-like protein [Phycisphaerae bacterium]|nr:HipA-like protein [Phycisphaerae bacterium]